jgi:hypothetical protein
VLVNDEKIKSLQLLFAPITQGLVEPESKIASVVAVGTPLFPEPSITQLDAVFQSVFVVPLQIGISL